MHTATIQACEASAGDEGYDSVRVLGLRHELAAREVAQTQCELIGHVVFVSVGALGSSCGTTLSL